ncbi:hypothetical protein GIB67_037246 [Kingdonia uniflora]|uniref:KIB1-4 beta-propeller domain-containing protein n=1 Tax=Kingdonia uniflora TaxID=39325 RepID=A0A7J7MS32_9MAGN|nr:hypothetical protein GIB67_037246 [Kingdonia uniflora]
MAIYAEKYTLGLYKSSTNAWSLVPGVEALEDTVHCKDEFYVVNCQGNIFACDVTPPSHVMKLVVPYPQEYYYDSNCKKYIVESPGELLLVIRV